ncbi:MAG: Rieske (2Fe-2S) protein [Acidimicrobiia bacterium]|nr:Rieske (2Fe-2S) protein [Acidimicrobiia bacterium]
MHSMETQRRSLVGWLLGGGLTASVISFLYPAVRFMQPPKVPEASINETVAGKIDEFKPNSGTIVKFGNRPALLIRVNETEWRAFNAICTHLNCTVQFEQPTSQIWCACHNGRFDINGQVVSGPPPGPLEEFQVRIREDEVFISKRA